MKTIKFGVGYYQLSDLILETGQSFARSLLSEERQLELLSHPKGDPDYVAKAILLQTDFQVKKNLKKLQQLMIPEGENQLVDMKMHNGVNYAVVDLDEFGVDFAGSQQNPDEFIWITLINKDQLKIGHLAFYNQQITLFTEYPVNICGQVNDIQMLCINTLANVLIEKPLRSVKMNIFCNDLEMNAAQPGILLQTMSTHFLCFGHCYTSETTRLQTVDCQIKAGVFIHKGYIESEQFTDVIAELVEMHGEILVKGRHTQGKKGLTIVTLGLPVYKTSHLHSNRINLIVGARVNGGLDLIYRANLNRIIQTASPLYGCLSNLIMVYLPCEQQDLIGETHFAGLISSRRLDIFAATAAFSGKTYIQGDIHVFTEGNNDQFIIEKNAKIFFNGRLFHQQSQLGARIEGSVQETPELEIYWKKIITPELALTTTEHLRSQLPHQLVSKVTQTPITKPGSIEFLPVLPEQESYLYKTYDKTQFEHLEVDDTVNKEKTPPQMLFSAEYLEVSGDFSLTSAHVVFQGKDIQFSAHFLNVSFFGCVDLLLKSIHLNLHGAVIDTNKQGGAVLICEQDAQISDSEIAAAQITIKADSLSFPAAPENKTETKLSAGKIIIKSEHNSKIAQGSKLTLTSPEPVIWQCENFDHRGTLDFQQLSLKAEHTVSMVFAKMHGKRLDLDSRYFLAGLSSFKIDTFSVQSVVSLIGLCYIASDYYCNTSIVNLSCALYTPSTLSLSLKSGLALCLAAANTAISILQLVLHEPTCQVALTAARLAINAGPALFQASQLVKDIHAATHATQITRGNLIKIANQTKTLVLSLGVLAYGGAGVAKQLVHIAELQSMPAAVNTWKDVLSTINNLDSVATPLLSTLFPGKHVSSFFNMDFDVSTCFSSTNYSLFDIHGGVNSSLIATRLSLVSVDPNPFSLNLSPVLSTDTNLDSLSCEQGLPVGTHIERTMEKTIVATPIPTLGESTSLSAHELMLIGRGEHEFKKSSLQVGDVFIAQEARLQLTDSSMKVSHQVVHEGEVKLDHSQLTAKDWESVASSQLLGKQSQFKTDAMRIAKEASAEFTDSLVSVSGQVEDAGKAQFTHSLISADHWQNDKDSAILLEQSKFQGIIDNQGAIECVQTQVEGEIHNHDGAATLLLNSELNLKITDDHGAVTQLVASELKTDQWQEAGLFAADAGSNIEGRAVNITQDAQVGSRMTNWNVSALTSEMDIPLDFKGDHFAHKTVVVDEHPHARHQGHKAGVGDPPDSEVKPVEFKYVDDSKLSAVLQADGVHYFSDNPIEIKNMDLISAMPIHVDAPDLTVSGHNTSTASVSLTGEHQVLFNHSNTTVNGSLNVRGDDVIFNGGQTLAGESLKVNGKEEIVIQQAAALLAKDDIDLDSKKKVMSCGEKTVETHTKVDEHFLRTDKSATTTTHFKNNQIISGSGDVNVHSDTDMLVEGTDVAGQNITLNTKADLVMNPLTGTDSLSKDHINYWGLHHDKYLQTVDTASPNHLVAEKKITFAVSGDMHNLGSELSAKEGIEYVLSKEDSQVTNSALILGSHTEQSHAGLGFHSFAGMKLPLDVHQYVSQLPLVQDSQQLAQAATTDDKLSALIDLSKDAVNTANNVLSAARGGRIIEGLEQLLLPNLNLTWRFGKSVVHTNHQRVGPGSIDTKHLSVRAKEASFSNFGITAESSYFDVDKISSTGAHLHNSVVAENNFAVFSLSPIAFFHPSLNNIGFTHSYDKSIHDVWRGDAMHLGDLTLQADEALFYGSQWCVKTLTGHVNKLIADAKANYVMHASSHACLFSSGSFSFGESEKFSNTAAITTPFVGENSDSYSADNFSIGESVSHGEKITNTHTGQREHSFNINGSGQDLLPGPRGVGQVFSTWNLRFNRLSLTAPIYHPAAGKRFIDNMSWLMRQTPPATRSVPAEINTASKVHEIKLFDDHQNSSKAQPSPVIRAGVSPYPFAMGEIQTEKIPPSAWSILFPHEFNFGPFVEMMGHDFENLEGLNNSFKILSTSEGFKTYLSNVESTLLTKKEMFNELNNTVFEPFSRTLYDRSSYFFPWYRRSDSSQFLSGVLEQPDIFKMAEQTFNNIDHYTENYSLVMKYLRIFYVSNLILQNAFEVSEGESILSLIKEDIYSTLGGIGIASVGEAAYIEAANCISCLKSINPLVLLKPLTFSLPVIGMMVGTGLGEYLAKNDRNEAMDISTSLASARQFWQAGTLRETSAAKFKEAILPDYLAETLSSSAIDSYSYYVNKLHNLSTSMGKALIKPINRDLLELSRISDKFSAAENFTKEFKKNSPNEYMNEYLNRIEKYELPKYDVDGEFFRKIIHEHSDFSDSYVNKLKNIGKSLFALAVVESLYELATSDDKINTVGRLALAWPAAEGGGCLGALAGLEFCGPYSPLCVAGLSLIGSAAGVLVAEKPFDPIHDGDDYRVSNFNTAINFFKPSERLQHPTTRSQVFTCRAYE